MSFTIATATPNTLDAVFAEVANWQHEGDPVQLHPGDLGWALRLGVEHLAAELRVWRRDGQIVAAGGVDAPTGLIRMAISPTLDSDEEFAAHLLRDFGNARRMQLSRPVQSVEARSGRVVRDLLRDQYWVDGESWTPLVQILNDSKPTSLRIETLSRGLADEQVIKDRVAVQRAAFANSTFTTQQWHTMAAGGAYEAARCLVGYDQAGAAVAATTVWSAGEGRPGLIEPLGVHRNHRGQGHGRAMVIAAANTLRELGASSMTVCTRSANVGAVAAYESAGMTRQPDSTDFVRPS